MTPDKQNYGGYPVKNNIVAFWNGPFSNWFPANFEVDGVRYCNTEQHMMAEKAKLFGDKETLALIMAERNPREQKALGRRIKGYDDAKWAEVRLDLVTKGNVAKFTQNADLKKFILGTNDLTIVEASPLDKIWGIGIAEEDDRAFDKSKWEGLNLLGEALMNTRKEIREKNL